MECSTRSRRSSYSAMPPRAERTFSNSEMSAPAANASVPAPRKMTQPTSGSRSKRSMAAGIPRHMAPLMAFLRAGWSKMIQPSAPRFSAVSRPSVFVVGMWHSMSMKAIVCKQYGPPESLSLEELTAPEPGPGEVVVSVKAASLNFPDVLIIQNKYQFKPPLPFSPGSELAGVVKAVGAGVDKWKPGDRVMAFTTYGAFAEEARTEASRLVSMAPSMSFETAAAFLLAYGTSDHALRDRGALCAGETLLVLGAAGGVGLAAVEIGRALGARVIACASTDEKLAVCRAHGAGETVNYATEDMRERIKALTGR